MNDAKNGMYRRPSSVKLVSEIEGVEECLVNTCMVKTSSAEKARDSHGLLTGHFYLLYLAAVTKFSDCGAYLLGSLIGKHPMIPHVSPKKTWEGFAGALLLPAFASWLLFRLMPEQLSLIFSSERAILLGLCLAIVAVVGDLAESVVKRATGVKDSGHFIPGIGGALDLVDSLLFTGPLLYLYLRYASFLS